MECRGCSATLAEGARFCPQCGHPKVFDETESPTELTPTETTGPRGNDSQASSPAGQSGPLPEAVRPSSPAPSRLGRLSSDSGPGNRFGFGEVLADRYRILGRIGGGGMGDVYRADDLKLGQPVALKFLPESLAGDQDRLGRLFSEVRLARQVSHRNVCRVYDIVEYGDQSFLSMEFVDGEDLGSLLRRAGRLAPEKATEIARQICAGLHAAHEKGILHRDLKPANILVDSEGVAHIADFGLAGFGEEIGKHEIRAGTPSYMAPEQVQGREVTVQSDLYALGLLLYEMYTGRRALSGKSLGEIEGRRSELITRTSTELSTLDPAVERAISRCLETDPALRPASALAVAAALPGGDPLAAALAAGELPSPEMIAASGSAGTLPVPIGLVALTIIVVGFALQIWLAPRALLHEVVGLPKSTAVLEDRAADLRRSFGYPDSLARDRAAGWRQDRAAVDYEERLHPEAPSWDSLSSGQPSPISFWFRESPSRLIPRNLVGNVGMSDPPRVDAGMVILRLSPRGDLLWWQAVPPLRPTEMADPTGRDDSAAPKLPVDRLFAAAGLDLTDFHEVQRSWNPPNFADEMLTLRGRYRDRPSFEIEVHIAGFEGRPTWFEIVDPWELDLREAGTGDSLRTGPGAGAGRDAEGSGRSGDDWTQGILQGMVILLILAASLLARRNTRLGQGDRRGGARLATFATVSMAGSLLLRANHVPVFQPEWNMINVTIGLGLVLGGLTWLMYIALEPFARRIWPETLISWSRLLQGRLRDPRVGRDLLLGIAVGTILGVSRPLRIAFFPAIGQPPIPPSGFPSGIINGFLDFLSTLLVAPLNAIWIPMAVLLLAIGIRVLLRRKRAAIVVSAVFFFAVLSLGAKGPVGVAMIAVGVVLFVGTLFRLGLLAMMALFLTTEFHGQLPFTSDLGAWYAWPSVVAMLGLFLLALHGFRLSRRHAHT